NIDRVVFFVLAKESVLALLKHADDLKVYAAHPHFRAYNVVLLSGEKRIGGVDADHYDIAALVVIGLGNKAPFPDRYVRDVCIIRRHTRGVAPAVIPALVSDVVVEGAAAITNVGRDYREIFHGARLQLNCIGIDDGKRFAQTLRTVHAGLGSGGQVKSIDVIGAVLFDDRDD